uniref:Group II intron reverse transcriptase/maturase n=1 Tax=Batrachospermum sp. TaxID=31373 RepID=A0A8K1YV60_9FLOR|nr:group II intron reverse transcriptase/maturase [Batrachospermum sp.]
MSKEIQLDFNTIFWVAINWKKNYGYVTRLKSRIYKAVINKAYDKEKKLQTKLFVSLAANLLALNQILQKQVGFFKYINDIEKLYIAQNINYIKTYSFKFVNKFASLSYGKEIFLKELNSLTIGIDKILIFFVLEPQWISYYRFNKIHFLTLIYYENILKFFEINLTSLSNQKLFFININYKNFIDKISYDYLLARINLTQIICLKLKTILLKNLFHEFILNLRTENVFKQFQLELCISRIIIYYLCVETYLVNKSYMHIVYKLSNYQQRIKIYDYGLELLVLNYDLATLKIWLNLFFQLIYSNINKSCKIFICTTSKSFNNLNFCGYSLIFNKYHNIYSVPNKLSQFILLSQIWYIFNNAKGKPAIYLVINLNSILEQWANYFKCTNGIKIFILIDYLIYLKLWIWAQKNHTNLAHKKIKEKYFTCLVNYTFTTKYHGWIFKSMDIKNKYRKQIFLIKLIWFALNYHIF